jgi:hypothetical protein
MDVSTGSVHVLLLATVTMHANRCVGRHKPQSNVNIAKRLIGDTNSVSIRVLTKPSGIINSLACLQYETAAVIGLVDDFYQRYRSKLLHTNSMQPTAC